MLHTVEMRWFFDHVPLDTDIHFEASPAELQQRVDWYLMPCNPRCGTKVREGMLQTKMQVAEIGQQAYGPLCGKLEAWKKWSLAFEADDLPTTEEMTAVNWLPIGKRRRLQRYEVAEDRVTPTDVRPSNGCEFELTELAVEDQTFWTVGFEAVGEPDRLASNLQTVAQEVVRRGGLLATFDAARSCGYAQWIVDQFGRR